MAGRWRKRSSQDWQTPVPMLGEFFFHGPWIPSFDISVDTRTWLGERSGRFDVRVCSLQQIGAE